MLNFDNDCKIHNGIITHEAVHTAHFIAGKRNIEPSFVNDEPIAYLTEWIVDEIYKFMHKNKMEAIS